VNRSPSQGMCPWARADVESFARIAAEERRLDGATSPKSGVRCSAAVSRPVTFLIDPPEAQTDPTI